MRGKAQLTCHALRASRILKQEKKTLQLHAGMPGVQLFYQFFTALALPGAFTQRVVGRERASSCAVSLARSLGRGVAKQH